MASNSFGNLFRITTWGESHGKAIGVVIDGCPAGLEISDREINEELARRSPGKTPYTTARKEKDHAEILSGVFEGKTTGTPISIIIYNVDANSKKYEPIKDLLRPGHSNFTYLEKYGIYDYRGGGRASARETTCRVAAGAIAKKLLSHFGIKVLAYVKQVEEIQVQVDLTKIDCNTIYTNPIFCPEETAAQKMMEVIEKAKEEGDSVGGVIELAILSLPAGLGDPIYEKLEANLAKAMLTIPATKGFTFGSGFHGAKMRGSTHNDLFYKEGEEVKTKTNHAGGTLGGISTGMPLICQVAFKPTPSIQKELQTIDTKGKEKVFTLPKGSRHDPCVAVRAVPIVEAMAALVATDSLLIHRSSRL